MSQCSGLRSISTPAPLLLSAVIVLASVAPGLAGRGDLDTTFGSSGVVRGPADNVIRALALYPDGRIVAAGSSNVARYLPNGLSDLTFGTEGGWAYLPYGYSADYRGVAVQSDGKIVLGGGLNGDFCVVRYNADGSLDSSFGGHGSQGVVTTDFWNAGADGANALVLQPDGKILTGGSARLVSSDPDPKFALARYNTDGSLDNSFGVGGKVITSLGGQIQEIFALALQPDGKILAAGEYTVDIQAPPYSDFVVARYNTDGTLDDSFGEGGRIITDIGAYEHATALTLDSQDRIVAVGSSETSGPNSASRFAVVRYLTNGSIDSTFGNAGIVTTQVGVPDVARAQAVATQDSDLMVVGGYASNGTDYDFALVGYNSLGALDSTFATHGILMLELAPGDDLAFSLVPDGQGRLLAGGRTTSDGGGADFGIGRFIVGDCGDGHIDFGEQCDDGNTTDGDCCSATCQYDTQGASCTDDGNICTDNKCDGAGTCEAINNTAACNDDLYCTVGDVCSGGSCGGSARDCTSLDGPCQVGECDEQGGSCVGIAANEGGACNDGLHCNGTDTCLAGACDGHSGDPCLPLNESDGTCAASCDEGADDCVAADPDGTGCDDGLYCTTGDVCEAGACSSAERDCGDDVGCTVDSCNEGTQSCDNTPDDGNCDDGAYCNGTERCHAQLDCQPGTPPTTDDGVGCTDDICDEGNDVVVNAPNDANCDNADVCDGNETCDPIEDCQPGTPLVCDNADACDGTETCDPVDGCQSGTPLECGNGDLCDGVESCDPEQGCQPGTPVSCDDADACTQDSCDPQTGECSWVVEPAPDENADPINGCKIAEISGLLAGDSANNRADKLRWKWIKGASTNADLGQPNIDTRYDICLYDTDGGAYSLAASMTIPPDADKWLKRKEDLWLYKDRDAAADGVLGASLKSGTGKAKITLKAGGENLPTPVPVDATVPGKFFSIDPTVTLQLHNSEGVCWTSEFDSAVKNIGRTFKTKRRIRVVVP